MYKQLIKDWMIKLAKKENLVFIGQQVQSDDFYGTLKGIDFSKRIEMPVAEELQMGMCIGMAMQGVLPVCIFQRMDFLLRASDQMVNHLSSLEVLKKYPVIIRTTIGTNTPFDTGIQHSKNLVTAFRELLSFPVYNLRSCYDVNYTYHTINEKPQTCLIVEHQDLYREEKDEE